MLPVRTILRQALGFGFEALQDGSPTAAYDLDDILRGWSPDADAQARAFLSKDPKIQIVNSYLQAVQQLPSICLSMGEYEVAERYLGRSLGLQSRDPAGQVVGQPPNPDRMGLRFGETLSYTVTIYLLAPDEMLLEIMSHFVYWAFSRAYLGMAQMGIENGYLVSAQEMQPIPDQQDGIPGACQLQMSYSCRFISYYIQDSNILTWAGIGLPPPPPPVPNPVPIVGGGDVTACVDDRGLI